MGAWARSCTEVLTLLEPKFGLAVINLDSYALSILDKRNRTTCTQGAYRKAI